MVRTAVLLAVLTLALAANGAGAAAAADGPPVFGVSVNRVINDDFTPAHWDAPLRAVRASGIAYARTDAFWMWAAIDNLRLAAESAAMIAGEAI